ncbi:hypothetical protein BLS_009755 [Venturia inaequalis]|uniref:Uncharacterized protein n=1 Tax=Venturia inaequalis TaxID=5025 RepID=A0A8H3U6D2_VENIN|nr:hypothetical protein BLS_009755 [Venturia inaequalis]
MVNLKEPIPAIVITDSDPPPGSPSAAPARVLRPANEVLDEVTWLTHLDFYTVRDGVVAAFDEDDLDSTPRAKGGRVGSKRHVDLDKVLSQIADLVKAYLLLHARFELKSKAATMFVQEAERPGVARLVEAGDETWKYVHDIVPIIRGGNRTGLRIAQDVVDSLLRMFGVQVEIREYIWLKERGGLADCDGTVDLGSAQLEDPLEWKLRLLHFVYALALVSSMNSHANEFNWQIWDDPVEYFKISESLTFRKYDIGSMGQFLGPVWILAGEVAFPLPDDVSASDVRPGRIGSVAHQEFAGIDFQHLSAKFSEQDLGGPTNTITEADTSTSEIASNVFDKPEGPSFTFQISVSIPQLRALWNANIKFAVEEQPIDREKIDAETMQQTSVLAIKSLEVGSGVVLPIGMPTLMELDVEVVCGWYSLDLEGSGNVITMADIEGDGDLELCDTDFLLII